MKSVIITILLVVIVVVPLNNVTATPPQGLVLEFCRYGLFSRLLGRCVEYEVPASYARSTVWCRSTEYSSALTGEEEGWICTDNLDNTFVIPYQAITVRNNSGRFIEITRHKMEFQNPMSYTQRVDPGRTSQLLYGRTDTAFLVE